jgi:hypothetical protein
MKSVPGDYIPILPGNWEAGRKPGTLLTGLHNSLLSMIEDSAILLQKGQSLISARLAEKIIALGQEVAVRVMDLRPGNQYPIALKSLQSMDEHRAIHLFQDVVPYFHHEIGTDSEDVAVKSRMMKRAQGQPVGNDRLAALVPVRQDVRGFQESGVPQPAYGAMLAVGAQHPLAECLLVHPAPHESRHIRTPHHALIRLG